MFCYNCGKKISTSDKFCINCGTKQLEEASEIKQEKIIEEYAGFWIRFGAFMVDYLIFFLIFMILAIVLFASSVEVGESFFSLFNDKTSDALLTFLLLALYHTFFLSLISSTPGKKLFGLRVCSDSYDGRLKFGTSLIRSLSYFLSSLLFSLGFISIAIDKKKHQGWHDSLARTVVMRNRNKNITLGVIIAIIGTITWLIIRSSS